MKIQINNLKKSFQQNETKLTILNGINLTIEKGEVVALLGKSGSGKSTILSLLSGLDIPDEGEIIIDGLDITKLNEEERCNYRAKSLGIIFQQFHLVPHLSALENVELALEVRNDNDIKKAKQSLFQVGLEERINHLPSMLSGGEQQRVAIARALVGLPVLLLADEPTGNLDAETGASVIEILFNLVKTNQTTMILVTHDEELALRADRIVRLSGGLCHS